MNITKTKGLVVACILAGSAVAFSAPHTETCQGFLPKNNLSIPVNHLLGGGISEQQFNDVINEVEAEYKKEVEQKGGKLVFRRKWTDPTVNASADRSGNTWYVEMYGGLARHPQITRDGFSLVVCHEVGHHVGGAPKYPYDWASNEGQADYYANLKCLRRVFAKDDNEAKVAAMDVDPLAREACEQQYAVKQDQLICIRGAMAGKSVAYLFQSLRKETKVAQLDTPDPSVVKETFDDHPGSQCRLDTYFSASLCTVPVSENLSDTDYRPGSCYNSKTHSKGFRPLCWFTPNQS